MVAHDCRRQRLEQLLELAQAYRGWSRKRLAKALGRDPTKLVPDSGNPKLDYVLDLSRVLDWPLDVVVESLFGSDEPVHSDVAEQHDDVDAEGLDAAAKQAHREGRYADMITLARRMYETAETSELRAVACNREAGGWDGLGRYSSLLEAVQRGLREPDVSSDVRMLLKVNLANAYYTLWQLVESRATARDLIDWFADHPPQSKRQHVVQAFAYYVRGHSFRRLIEMEPEHATHFAALARADLDQSRRLHTQLADQYGDDAYRGIANTCVGGMMEVEVVLGERQAGQVIEQFSSQLDALVDPAVYPVGDQLESFGWWCIFACNVALRHLTDEKRLQQAMAVFTNKADEIANHIDNWSMRERVFTMEFARRQRLSDWTGLEPDWTIDSDDVRVLAGTMGRFPAFHGTGWRILQTARVIRNS